MYESCRNYTFSYIVFYIYIYIYSSVFQHFYIKSAKYTKKRVISSENDRNHCVFSRKRTKTNHFSAFSRIFHAFRSVFAEISLCGNDNGEFTHDFVAEQTTHTRHRCKNKSASPNIPPPPGYALRLAVWRITLIFHKNFCIIFIQGKGKNKYSTLEKIKK